MAEINADYYGTKEQWLKALNTTDTKLKIGINGSIKGYHEAGKLAVNEKLDQSIKMFGFTNNVADKLHYHSVYFDSDTNTIVHVQDYAESGNVGYFTTVNSGLINEDVRYNKQLLNQANQQMINGLGLENFTTALHMDRSYPVTDFDYLHHVNLIRVGYMKDFQFDESKGYTFSSIQYADLDTFYDKLNTGTNVICCYWLETYSGISTSNRGYSASQMLYCMSDFEYPVGNRDQWGYKTFTYFPRQYNVQGGGSPGMGFEVSASNKLFTFCYNGGDKWELISAYWPNGNKQILTRFNGTKEDILQQACFGGLYFTGTQQKAQYGTVGAEMTDDGIYAPIIEDGIITGEYKAGKEAAKLPQSTWAEDIKGNSGYDPATPPEPTPVVTPLKKPALTGTNAFTSTYLLREDELKKFVDICCNSDDTILTQIVNDLKMFGEKPLEAVTSLMLFPFNTQHYTSSTSTDTIKLGKYDTQIRGIICNDSSVIFDMGSITVPTANNFLSYEPYSTALLYVPYCGMTPLSMQYISGKTLSVSITVDIMTGGCEGVVFCNGVAIAYLNGVIGCQIPLTSSDNYSIVNSLLDNLKAGTSTFVAGGKTTTGVNLTKQSTAGKIGSTVASVAGQAGLGIAGTALSTAKDVAFDYFTEPTHFSSSGTAGSALSYFNPQYPYLIIEKTTSNETADYGYYVGYRVDDYKTLSSLTDGDYIQCSDVVLENIPGASAEELDIIENALKAGVYI